MIRCTLTSVGVQHKSRGENIEVNEAYDGSGATYDFFAQLFGRRSIDGEGMHLDSTVHYGTSSAERVSDAKVAKSAEVAIRRP